MLCSASARLIKFRACYHACVVSGDAMEVRGGVGYVEAWPDAQVLRDAHRGSIREGTSNIVLRDVLRPARGLIGGARPHGAAPLRHATRSA